MYDRGPFSPALSRKTNQTSFFVDPRQPVYEQVTKKEYFFFTFILFVLTIALALMLKDVGTAYTLLGSLNAMLIS